MTNLAFGKVSGDGLTSMMLCTNMTLFALKPEENAASTQPQKLFSEKKSHIFLQEKLVDELGDDVAGFTAKTAGGADKKKKKKKNKKIPKSKDHVSDCVQKAVIMFLV